jgi:hypothetical protein
MSFYRDGNLCFFPPSLISLKHLTKLDLSRTEVGSEKNDMDNLFAFAKAHPNMEYLGLYSSILSYSLDDDNTIDFEVNNALELMCLIAEKMNFSYDTDWNTQRLGKVLIDELNNPNRSTEKTETKLATPATNLGANVVDLNQATDVQR